MFHLRKSTYMSNPACTSLTCLKRSCFACMCARAPRSKLPVNIVLLFWLNNRYISKKSPKYNGWFPDWLEDAVCAFTSYRSNPWIQDHYARGRMCQNPVLRFFGVSPQSKKQILQPNVFLCASVSLNLESIFKTSSKHTGSSQKSLNNAAWGFSCST